MNVYEKLQSARVKLQNTTIKKSGKNKYANFEYFELSDFLPHVNEIFNEHKLTSVFNITSEVATLEVINSEKPEEKISFCSPLVNADVKGAIGIQQLGATHTYFRRYMYLIALEIVEHDMVDALPQSGKEQTQTQNTITDTMIKALNMRIETYSKEFGYTVENVNKGLKNKFKKEVKDYTYEDYQSAINFLEKEPKRG
jgi:hypothetical protein